MSTKKWTGYITEEWETFHGKVVKNTSSVCTWNVLFRINETFISFIRVTLSKLNSLNILCWKLTQVSWFWFLLSQTGGHETAAPLQSKSALERVFSCMLSVNQSVHHGSISISISINISGTHFENPVVLFNLWTIAKNVKQMESYCTLVRTTARFHLIHVWR